VLPFLPCVEVVKVAVELVEAVVGRRVFVAVNQMFFPNYPVAKPSRLSA
jgi:hypothetical protein